MCETGAGEEEFARRGVGEGFGNVGLGFRERGGGGRQGFLRHGHPLRRHRARRDGFRVDQVARETEELGRRFRVRLGVLRPGRRGRLAGFRLDGRGGGFGRARRGRAFGRLGEDGVAIERDVVVLVPLFDLPPERVEDFVEIVFVDDAEGWRLGSGEEGMLDGEERDAVEGGDGEGGGVHGGGGEEEEEGGAVVHGERAGWRKGGREEREEQPVRI